MAKRRPYSLVLIGARKESARTKYLQFLAGAADRPSRIGSQGARPERVSLAVQPFAFSLPENILAQGSALLPAVVSLQGIAAVSERVKLGVKTGAPATSTPTGVSLTRIADTDELLGIKNFSPARIIRRVYQTKTATKKNSEITGLAYGYRKSTSVSVPFGKKNATDTITDAFKAVSDAIEGADGNGLTQVFLKEEDV